MFLFLIYQLALSKIYFQETFDDPSVLNTKWILSTWKQEEGLAGKFEIASPKSSNIDDNLGLKTTEDSKFYDISANFEDVLNTGNHDKVFIQYQLKQEQPIECGGGYVKLGPKMTDPKKFGDPSTYYIMFGPDECGGANKRIHLIFHYKGNNVLKTNDISSSPDTKTTVYRLVLHKNGKVEVEVNGASVYSGLMLDDWKLLKPRTIDDPNDIKPDDWVDDAEIDDPSDTKPIDWVDERQIQDSKATKPDDWDDEEDGEWQAPMIDNPDWKGEWFPKRIPNPSYKGPWKAKQIDNPDFQEDEEAHIFKDIEYIGVDVWQVKSGTIFDNFLVTDDEEIANSWRDRAIDIRKAEDNSEHEPAGDDEDDQEDEL